MRSWHILNAEPENYSGEAVEILKSVGTVDLSQKTRANLTAALQDVDVLIVRLAFQLTEDVFKAAPNLRAIVTATTGLDHIDLEAAERHGINVLSLRGEVDFLQSIPATAELTWGLLLTLTRNIPAAFSSVLNGEWERDRFKGHDLAGKRLGILGLGRIGRIVARYGLAFGMKASAFDPTAQNWVDGVERMESLTGLLQVADVLSIHVPLNPDTVGLIGGRELDLLPAGALLINTSRGDIVNEPALITALQSGQLAGAAVDVVSMERIDLLEKSALLQYARAHKNLIITPHIGGASYESMAATEIFMARKLVNYLATLEQVE